MHSASFASFLAFFAHNACVAASPMLGQSLDADSGSTIDGETIAPSKLKSVLVAHNNWPALPKRTKQVELKIKTSGEKERVATDFFEAISGSGYSTFSFRWKDEEETASQYLIVPIHTKDWEEIVKWELRSTEEVQNLKIETPEKEEGSLALAGNDKFPVLLRTADSVLEKKGDLILDEKNSYFKEEKDDEEWTQGWKDLKKGQEWKSILDPVMEDIDTLINKGWTLRYPRLSLVLHTKDHKPSIRMFPTLFSDSHTSLRSWDEWMNAGLLDSKEKREEHAKGMKKEIIEIVTVYAQKSLGFDKTELKESLVKEFDLTGADKEPES